MASDEFCPRCRRRTGPHLDSGACLDSALRELEGLSCEGCGKAIDPLCKDCAARAYATGKVKEGLIYGVQRLGEWLDARRKTGG